MLDQPTATADPPRVLRLGPVRRAGAPPPLWAISLACIALAALSLLGPHELTYDPRAWLIWGREIVHGELETVYGPSWKPLPVVFTAPFTLLGHETAPLLWLVVARAGGLMALVLAFRLAARIAGPVAGALAAGSLLLSDAFVSYVMRGNSEGLLAAVTLGAVDRHLDGRRGQAFALAVAAALLRPEVWPIVGLYGLWLVRIRSRDRVHWPTVALVAASGVGIVAAWVVPEYIGSGDLLRAASRARVPVEGMPAEATFPFLAVFTNAAPAVAWPLYAGGVLVVVLAWRDRARDWRARLVLVLAAIATAVMVLVALLTQTVGFTGNSRYLTVPIAIVCVLGAIGIVRAARLAPERLGDRRGRAAIAAAALVAVPFVLVALGRLSQQWVDVRREARDYGALPDVIARAGGPGAVRRCGLAFTTGILTQAVAWELRTHQSGVGIVPNPPGTVIVLIGPERQPDDRFPHRVSNSEWILASSCRLPGNSASR